MFTLKLYRRPRDENGNDMSTGNLETLIMLCDRVFVQELGDRDQYGRRTTLQIVAFRNKDDDLDSKEFYVGERHTWLAEMGTPHYGWALLENMAGKTTQHFRPHSYG